MAAPLVAAYSHLGRHQEARAALENFKKLWPFSPLPLNLQVLMYGFPFKDPQVANRLADGLLKAGLPGEPSGYFKIYDKNKLTGEEIINWRTIVDRLHQGRESYHPGIPGL